MSLITPSYFFGDLLIAQSSQTDVANSIQWFIDKYEPKLLGEIFGYQLYKDFKAGLLTNPVPQIWLDLLFGVEYTNKWSKLAKWPGLIQVPDGDTQPVVTVTDGIVTITGTLTQYDSLIADYVYYWYRRDNETVTVGNGEGRGAMQNATQESAAVKACRAWDAMSKIVIQLYEFLEVKRTTYTGYVKPNYLYTEIISTIL